MSIVATFAKQLAEAAMGPVLGVVKDLGGKWINKQVSDEQFKTELQKVMLIAFSGLWAQQAEIIKAEITSDDWLTRKWRPMTAITFAFVLVFYALLLPIAVDWLGAPPLRTSDVLLAHIVTLLTIAFTGYVGGRSAEKIADKILRKGE
jgi:VIT1/CCC1 family predicted Fe2+/Mn2+ transporter